MRTVTVPFAGAEVQAEVERVGENDFVVLWHDPAAVRALGLSEEKTAALIVRCELECLRLGALDELRLRDGIAGLIDDSEPILSSERDSRASEVNAA